MLVGIAIGNASAEARPRTYVCSVVAVVAGDENGKLGQNDWTKLLSKNRGSFVFSEADGMLRWVGTDTAQQFEVLQNGSDDNSMIAAISVKGAASYVHETLRIRTFRKPWVFRYEETTTISTGVCQ